METKSLPILEVVTGLLERIGGGDSDGAQSGVPPDGPEMFGQRPPMI
jgi:hypothetical protein